MIKTRKIKLHVQDKNNWPFIYTLNNQIWRAANTIIKHQALNDTFLDRIIMNDAEMAEQDKKIRRSIANEYEKRKVLTDNKKIANVDKKIKQLYNQKKTLTKQAREKAVNLYLTGEQNTTYRIISKEFPEIPSSTRAMLNKKVTGDYSDDYIEMKQGKRSIRSYKKGHPIPVVKKDIDLRTDEVKLFNKINCTLVYSKDKSNNRIIVKRILSGKYSLKDSEIQLKNKDLFLLMAVEIPDSEKKLDENIQVGVDLGLSVPAYVAIADSYKRKAIMSKDDVLRVRLQLQKRKKQLQKNLQYAKGGKGQKRKLKALDRIKETERNFMRTMNHKISKVIVDFALQNNAGIINMEDLSTFSSTENNQFVLRNWSYFELQKFIEYKAKEENIEVRKINPYHTSQVCHKCGYKGERKKQADFTCINPNCEINTMNADYNAALNISAGGIKNEKHIENTENVLPF